MVHLTGLEWPCSSVVEPTLGGSTITSYIIPENSHIETLKPRKLDDLPPVTRK